MYYLCLILIYKKKAANLIAQDRQLTRWNKFIIFWAIFLGAMKSLHAFVSIFIATA